MDYKYIDREIDNFFEDFFKDQLESVESNFELIEDNNLLTPKINYVYGMEFLSQTYQKFKKIDPNFAPDTLEKLLNEVSYIENIKLDLKIKTNNPQNLFKSEFAQYSYVLRSYEDSVKALKGSLNKSLENTSAEFFNSKEIVGLEVKKENLVKLKKIYYKEFKARLINKKRKIESDLNIIINSKLFYFDRLLWKYSNKSYKIFSNLEVMNLDKNFTSHQYLVKILDIIRPDTEKYNYLKKCLKIYK